MVYRILFYTFLATKEVVLQDLCLWELVLHIIGCAGLWSTGIGSKGIRSTKKYKLDIVSAKALGHCCGGFVKVLGGPCEGNRRPVGRRKAAPAEAKDGLCLGVRC